MICPASKTVSQTSNKQSTQNIRLIVNLFKNLKSILSGSRDKENVSEPSDKIAKQIIQEYEQTKILANYICQELVKEDKYLISLVIQQNQKNCQLNSEVSILKETVQTFNLKHVAETLNQQKISEKLSEKEREIKEISQKYNKLIMQLQASEQNINKLKSENHQLKTQLKHQKERFVRKTSEDKQIIQKLIFKLEYLKTAKESLRVRKQELRVQIQKCENKSKSLGDEIKSKKQQCGKISEKYQMLKQQNQSHKFKISRYEKNIKYYEQCFVFKELQLKNMQNLLRNSQQKSKKTKEMRDPLMKNNQQNLQNFASKSKQRQF